MGEEASAALSWLESAGDPLPALAAAALLVVTAWCVGSLLTASRRGISRSLVSMAVGLTLVGWLAAIISPTGLFRNGRSVWALVVLGIATGLVAALRRPGGRARESLSSAATLSSGASSKLATMTVALLALFTLGPALVLPDGWDELVYHVELPRRWLESGVPRVDADLPYSAFPSLPELLFWLASPINVEIAPRLVNWLAWAAAVVLLNGICRRSLTPWPAAFVTLAFALSPAVLMVSANCYVEAFLLMELAALMAVVTAPVDEFEGAWRRTVLIGVLSGGAASVKLTGLIAIAFPVVEAWMRPGTAGQKLRWASVSTVIALGVCLPFYLRPLLATGNPFYPYFDNWFSTDVQRAEMSSFHHSVTARFGLHNVIGLLTGPALLAFNDLLYDGTFGWQLLVLLVLAVIGFAVSRRDGATHVCAAFAGVLYLGWFFTSQQARFITPAALVGAVVASRGLAALGRFGRRAGLISLVVATVVSLPWRNAGYYFSGWETLAGYWTKVENLNDGTRGGYLPLVAAVESTPADARLLLLFEHRGLYLRRSREIGTPGFRAGGVPRACETDASQLRDWMKSKQISHVVLSRTPQGPDQTPEWRESVEYVYRAIELAVREGILQVEWESETHVLLRVVLQSAQSKI